MNGTTYRDRSQIPDFITYSFLEIALILLTNIF